ncbi:fructose-specific PTS transporter subunit EIIC [Corynebacterium sp. HMSC04H06]|uniref:fructose-specific PTS transporter subunit EIIC n=1 Tax=Corynebacterium sp. HMSC04H06 TaxID=1581050 RepID=UPI0008A415B5|nr:fructose-specific PTS transporter subunit EIIC [Corynebacterium sp. HMSC04H06]OFS21846.1 PTS mannose transporter subunit IIABC [Corynebacterium sp. HMSC04H06]
MSDNTKNPPRILAITACPTGIAHTYMAAENLTAAAQELGFDLQVETHGSIGVEGAFTPADIEAADAILIGADTVINKERFVGKRLLATGVDDAIKRPNELLRQSLEANTFTDRQLQKQQADQPGQDEGATSSSSGIAGVGQTMYKALMNGVSHMIPFVVTGGLLLAVALSIGGTPTPEGLAIPEGSFWFTISELGTLAFSLMVPVLSGYIAVGIADRPGLAPGLITGFIATTGSLYGSEAGAGFLGGIVTGILSGYVALGIRKIPVHKFIAPIWPIIVIPILTTLTVGLAFIWLIGAPIASVFAALTEYLAGMQGASMLVLGAIIGAMMAFDMGGPFNKTAFLFGGGMIASGNALPMGMAAAAIAVPPLAVGLATLIRRAWFTKAERDSGIAALFMGFFGITEGAIPLAAARPLQVIPANVVGGAIAGALAGAFGAADHVMHGGPIVALLGAVDNVVGFFIAMAAGVAATTILILVLVGLTQRKNPAAEEAQNTNADTADSTDANSAQPGTETTGAAVPAGAAGAATATKSTTATATTPSTLIDPSVVLLDPDTVSSRDDVIRELVAAAATSGRITDADAVVDAAVAREAKHSTSVGNAVAIPHARVAGVAAPTLAFARLDEPGIPWAADEEPSRLVFLIAVPDDAGKQHLKLLSKLARSLMKQDFRDKLFAAADRRAVVALVEEAVA